jgi:peptide/nickel transport system substrate-binding protein
LPPEPSLSRRFFLVGAILVIAAIVGGVVLIARSSGGGGATLPATSTYIEGVAGTWQRINPLYAATNDVDQDLTQLIFSGLTRIGPTGTVLPDLAELPQISDAGKTYTFKLRKNLTWQDGAALTSSDVAFTVARVTDPDFKGDASLAEGWQGVEVETPDAATVVFHLRQASAPFLVRNTTLGILPEHLLGRLSAAALFEAPFNSLPVGSGPYRLESLDSREARLVANLNYHLGRPGIGNLRIRFYTDYPSALRALAAGELRGLMIRDNVTDTELAEIGRLKGMKVEQLQRAAYLLLYLNNDQAAFFQDERVRRAISLAIDRQGVVDRIFLGLATPSSSPIAPGTWPYAKEYEHVRPEVAEAKQLLDEAGWKPHPTTGILVKEGAEFRFTIRTDNDPTRVAVAGEIARELEPFGIRATVASTTFSVLRRDFLSERKYDAAVAGWDQGADPDPYFGWHSSQMGTAGLNIANFADVVADSLIAKGRTSVDTEVRKDAYRQFQEVWDELSPSAVLAYPRYIYIHTDALKGYQPGVLFTPSARFVDIYRWKL